MVGTFFQRVPAFVSRHRLCDLAFCFVMQRDPNTIRFMPSDDDFVYFYSRGASIVGSVHVSLSPVWRAAAPPLTTTCVSHHGKTV